MLSLSLFGNEANNLPAAIGLVDVLSPTLRFPWGTAKLFEYAQSEDECTIALYLDLKPNLQQNFMQNTAPIEQFVNTAQFRSSILLSQAMDAFWRIFQDSTLPRFEGDFRISISAIKLIDQGQTAKVWFENAGFEISTSGNSPFFNITVQKNGDLTQILKTVAILIPALDAESGTLWQKENAFQFANYASSQIAMHPDFDAIKAEIQKGQYAQNMSFLDFHQSSVAESKPNLPANSAPMTEQSEIWKRIQKAFEETESKRILSIGIPEPVDCLPLIQNPNLVEFAITELETSDLQAFIPKITQYPLPQNIGQILRLFPTAPIFKYDYFDRFDAIVVPMIQNWIQKYQLSAFEESIFPIAKPKLLLVGGALDQFQSQGNGIQWNLAQAKSWANSIANQNGYLFSFESFKMEDRIEWLATFHFAKLR